MTNPPVPLGVHGRAFAQNMRTVRHAKGITLADLVTRMAAAGHRMTSDQLTRIEAGQRRASVDDACQIASALDVMLSRLVLPSHIQLIPNRPPRGAFLDVARGTEVVR